MHRQADGQTSRHGPHRRKHGGSRNVKLAYPVDSLMPCVRKPVELMQRFPCVSLHEELVSVDLLYGENMRLLGPHPFDVYSTPQQTLVSSAAVVALHDNVKGMQSRLACCQFDHGAVAEVPAAPSVVQYYFDVQRRDIDTPVDDVFGDDVLSSDGEEECAPREEDRVSDDRNSNRKRTRDGDTSLPQGPIPASLVPPSLRNHVGVSLPRLKNTHSASDRLLLLPVVNYPDSDTNTMYRRCVATLLEVTDEALKTTTRECSRNLGRGDAEQDYRTGSTAKSALYSPQELMIRALRESNEVMDGIRRNRGALPECGGVRKKDIDLLQQRDMLPGLAYPPGTIARLLGDSTDLEHEISDVVVSLLGEGTAIEYIPFLKFTYLRQRMSAVTSMESVDFQSANSDSPIAVTLDGKTIVDPLKAKEQLAADAVKQHRLRSCSIVDSETSYETLVVVVLIQDTDYAAAAAAEPCSHMFDSPLSSGADSDCVTLKNDPNELLTISQRFGTSLPFSAWQHDGVEVISAALRKPNTESLFPSVVSCVRSSNSGHACFTIKLSEVDAFAPRRRSRRCGDQTFGVPPTWQPTPITQCPFLSTREDFERALSLSHLLEIYEAEIAVQLLVLLRRRKIFAPLVENYKSVEDRILSTARSERLVHPDEGVAKGDQKAGWETAVIRRILELRATPEFSQLFGGIAGCHSSCQHNSGQHSMREVLRTSSVLETLCSAYPIRNLLLLLRRMWCISEDRSFSSKALLDSLVAAGASMFEARELLDQCRKDFRSDQAVKLFDGNQIRHVVHLEGTKADDHSRNESSSSSDSGTEQQQGGRDVKQHHDSRAHHVNTHNFVVKREA